MTARPAQRWRHGYQHLRDVVAARSLLSALEIMGRGLLPEEVYERMVAGLHAAEPPPDPEVGS